MGRAESWMLAVVRVGFSTKCVVGAGETQGIERSATAAQQAREVLYLDVGVQDLDELIADGVSFDAVVLWHVAEHLHDPATTLRNVASLLRPGGVLMIAVPNFGSPEAKIGKAGWFHLDVPRHVFHFTSAPP